MENLENTSVPTFKQHVEDKKSDHLPPPRFPISPLAGEDHFQELIAEVRKSFKDHQQVHLVLPRNIPAYDIDEARLHGLALRFKAVYAGHQDNNILVFRRPTLGEATAMSLRVWGPRFLNLAFLVGLGYVGYEAVPKRNPIQKGMRKFSKRVKRTFR